MTRIEEVPGWVFTLKQFKGIKPIYSTKGSSMSSQVLKAVNLDSNHVKFSESIKTNKFQGKSVYANYKNLPLRIQMPKMSLPFGVSRFVNPDKPEEVKYSVDLSFDKTSPSLLTQFEEIEEKVIDYAEKNSKELFKKQLSKEMLREFFKSSIRFSEDENGERSTKYAPRLKAKMYTDVNNLFSCAVYDSVKVDGKYQKITLTEDNVDEIVGKGSSCESILSCSGIWVVNKSFGVSWVLSQMKIYKNENVLSGYAFADDEEEETQEVEETKEDEEEIEILEEEIEQVSISSAPPKKTRRKRESFE